uniref:Uncharacterized protein n=1 Tax=Anguilla anguilla TaxID=7936 RepID=A0A0E9Q6W2_ANGAN
MASRTPFEDSASNPVNMGVVPVQPGEAQDHRELRGIN